MAPRPRRSLDDVLAETTPEKTPELPQEEMTWRREGLPSARAPKPVRSTMDLPPAEHAEFLKFAVDASTATGLPIKGQHVLRAMVRRLRTDPEWAAAIVRDLADGKGKV